MVLGGDIRKTSRTRTAVPALDSRLFLLQESQDNVSLRRSRSRKYCMRSGIQRFALHICLFTTFCISDVVMTPEVIDLHRARQLLNRRISDSHLSRPSATYMAGRTKWPEYLPDPKRATARKRMLRYGLAAPQQRQRTVLPTRCVRTMLWCIRGSLPPHPILFLGILVHAHQTAPRGVNLLHLSIRGKNNHRFR